MFGSKQGAVLRQLALVGASALALAVAVEAQVLNKGVVPGQAAG